MSNIPQVSGKKVVKALQKLGYVITRQKGSHIRLVKIEKGVKQLVTVPDHKVIRKGNP